jgi:hypothetical protein
MINLLAMATIALLEPFMLFNLIYRNRIQGSLVIKIQLLSISAVLTLQFPERVILPCRVYSPVEPFFKLIC